MGIADGVDEVYKSTVARRVLHDYEPHEEDFSREFIPYKKEAIWNKMQPILDVNL